MNNEGKFVFRPQNGKFPHSSNNVLGCNTCLKEKEAGVALRVCSACKFTGYCNRACQEADWKAHKPFCKEKQEMIALLSSLPGGLAITRYNAPKIQALEDFSHIHTFTFQKQLHWALRLTEPFDLRKKHYKVSLEERLNGDGNPATAFIVKSVTLCDHSTPGSFYMELISQVVQRSYDRWESFEKDKDGYEGIVVVVYVVDGNMPWILPFSLTPLRVFPPKDPENWFSKIKTWTDKGLVFRMKEFHGARSPGMLIKNKADWVWREKTLQELKEKYAIDLRPDEFFQIPPWIPIDFVDTAPDSHSD